MAENEDKLRLNSLDRFSKKSKRLVLEEHSHCEVPAGCGGVILRWINPAQGRAVLLWLYCPGQAEVFIDGVAPASSRPLVLPGHRVVGIHLSGLKKGKAGFMFAALDDPKTQGAEEDQQTPLLLSLEDGSWRYTSTKPKDDAWMKAGFDDKTWHFPSKTKLTKPTWQEPGATAFHRLEELKAETLGPDPVESEVWVRASLDVPAPTPGGK